MAKMSFMINLEVILSFRNFCLSIKEFISLFRRCLDSLLTKFFSCDKQQTVTRKGNKGGQFSEYWPIRNSTPCSCGIPLHACTWGSCLLERKKNSPLREKLPTDLQWRHLTSTKNEGGLTYECFTIKETVVRGSGEHNAALKVPRLVVGDADPWRLGQFRSCSTTPDMST